MCGLMQACVLQLLGWHTSANEYVYMRAYVFSCPIMPSWPQMGAAAPMAGRLKHREAMSLI